MVLLLARDLVYQVDNPGHWKKDNLPVFHRAAICPGRDYYKYIRVSDEKKDMFLFFLVRV
jgi:hypothetical protein